MPALHRESFPHLMAAFALLRTPVLQLNTEGQVLSWNDEAARIWPGQTLPLSWQKLWDEDMQPQMEELLARTLTEGTAQSLQRQALGSLSLSWKAQLLRDPKQKPQGFTVVGIDHSAEEILERQLQETYRLIRDHKNALDESSIVAITDQKGVIHYCNDTFCRISGYSRDEIIGKTHALLKSGFHDEIFFSDLWRTIAKGQVWKGEIKNRRKDGQYYWVDTTIVPFLGENGRPYQYMAIRNDITEKKMMQENLEKERMRVLHAEKMASLGELAAGIAHELGNPAASINAWLDVIESQHERDTLDIDLFIQTIPKVRRDAKRIADIIRGMLAYARDGSRDPFQSESPQTIMQQVIDYCSYKIRKCGVQVQLDVANPYATVECRITEISQMLVNFVLNACDAVQELEERWIRLEAKELGDTIEFRITDSGHGIPAASAERIFSPFYTTKPLGKGTGLGLSIAKSIVDNHRGQITLDQASPNTCFVIRLPRRHPRDDY